MSRDGRGSDATQPIRRRQRAAKADARPDATTVVPRRPAPPLPDPPAIDPSPVAPGRYEDLGLIAVGGMGEVRRVRDRLLERELVVKVLKPELAAHVELERLFAHEARLTAGLQHPHVVPVHELGRWTDGRLFFSMKEVHGHTLLTVIRELHAASRHGAWGRSPNGWTFRRVIDVFHQVALTVAYAHARGVVHGDLKPENVMVGPYGEVQVMDWGLASYLVPGKAPGALAGTPAYMAPEQARGAGRAVATDIYALGATLYEILTGSPPFVDQEPARIVLALREGARPAPIPRVEDSLVFAETRDQPEERPEPTVPPVPRALATVVDRAMALLAEDRHPSARSLADDVNAFVEGTRRFEEALELVARANDQVPEIARLRERAAGLRRRAAERLASLPRLAPETRKRKAWAFEDEAAALEREADLREIDLEGTLRGVLSIVPTLPSAHAALARQLRARHEAREAAGDHAATGRLEIQLRAHALALPKDHPERPELVRYLKGEGALTLHTAVPAEVVAHRYELVDRRLVPLSSAYLGTTPLDAVPLPMGSYLLALQAPGRPEVRYPVRIERNAHWSGRPPGAHAAHPIAMPEDLPADEVYVPAGFAVVGGGGQVAAQAVWVDGFVIDRYPLTNARYLEFLNDLVARGRADEAARHVPRERTSTEEPHPMYLRDRSGRYALGRDADGDEWQPDWPVILVDWTDASAYARWRRERDGRPWRLPSEWERDKASRGVDGRTYPWGEQEEDAWAATVVATEERRTLLSPVDTYPLDESPYGMRHNVGNVLDWCLESRSDPVPDPGGRVRVPTPVEGSAWRCLRGGGWYTLLRNGKCGIRAFTQEFSRLSYLGFRCAYSVSDRGPAVVDR